jgi:hypothetical protein
MRENSESTGRDPVQYIDNTYIDPDEPHPDDEVWIIAIVIIIAFIIGFEIFLIFISLYSLYDFFFVGTPIFRLLTPAILVVHILFFRWLIGLGSFGTANNKNG